jgi:hypothetical protein
MEELGLKPVTLFTASAAISLVGWGWGPRMGTGVSTHHWLRDPCPPQEGLVLVLKVASNPCLPSCGALNKLLNCSVPPFPHLQNGG